MGFATPGILLLCGVGTYLPAPYMRTWGIVCWLCGVFLIAYGLIPYRRLSKLSLFPIQLWVEPDKVHIRFSRNKEYKIQSNQIYQVCFVQRRFYYGIQLFVEMRGSTQKLWIPFFEASVAQTLMDTFTNDVMHPNQSH